jgi:methionyl-tRNA synthetase
MLLDMLGVDEEKRSIDFTKPGSDYTYGKSKIPVGKGKGQEGVLFPPLV